MRSVKWVVVAAIFSACSGATTGGTGGSGGAGGGTSAPGGGSGGGTSSTGGGSGGGAVLDGGTGGTGGSGGIGGFGGTGGDAGFDAGPPEDAGNFPIVEIDFRVLDGGVCPSFTPCSGDLVNRYLYTTACIDRLPVPGAQCAGTMYTALSGTIRGELIFSSDGGLSRNVRQRLQGTVKIVAPNCTIGCSLVPGVLAAQGVSATCQSGADSCDCDFTLDRSLTASAQWSTTGSTLTLDESDGGRSQSEFCATLATATLQLHDITPNNPNGGASALTAQ